MHLRSLSRRFPPFRQARGPIVRLGRFLRRKGWGGLEEEQEQLRAEAKRETIEALMQAERVAKPAALHLFTDVFDELTPALVRQRQQLKAHLHKYPEHYELPPEVLEGL